MSDPRDRYEPILTRILGELAPIVGGDLLSGGIKHRIGLAAAISEKLVETDAATPSPAIPEAGLDRERLALAMASVEDDFVGKASLWTERAEKVATEYERLRAEPVEKGAPE